MIEWCQYTKIRVLPNTVMAEKIPDRVPETFSSIWRVGTSIDLFEVHLTALKIPRKGRNGRIIFGIQLQRPMKGSFQGMI
jgi:hypothetical protein